MLRLASAVQPKRRRSADANLFTATSAGTTALLASVTNAPVTSGAGNDAAAASETERTAHGAFPSSALPARPVGERARMIYFELFHFNPVRVRKSILPCYAAESPFLGAHLLHGYAWAAR